MRKRPPPSRMRLRPDSSVSPSVQSGRVSPMIQEIVSKRRMRMPRARVSPSRRARPCWAAGSFATRIAMNTTLSMPRTISMRVSVARPRRASTERSALMARPSYPALRRLAIDAARADGRPAPSGEREPRGQRGMRFGARAIRMKCDAYQARPASGSVTSALKYESRNRSGARYVSRYPRKMSRSPARPEQRGIAPQADGFYDVARGSRARSPGAGPRRADDRMRSTWSLAPSLRPTSSRKRART